MHNQWGYEYPEIEESSQEEENVEEDDRSEDGEDQDLSLDDRLVFCMVELISMCVFAYF